MGNKEISRIFRGKNKKNSTFKVSDDILEKLKKSLSDLKKNFTDFKKNMPGRFCFVFSFTNTLIKKIDDNVRNFNSKNEPIFDDLKDIIMCYNRSSDEFQIHISNLRSDLKNILDYFVQLQKRKKYISASCNINIDELIENIRGLIEYKRDGIVFEIINKIKYVEKTVRSCFDASKDYVWNRFNSKSIENLDSLKNRAKDLNDKFPSIVVGDFPVNLTTSEVKDIIKEGKELLNSKITSTIESLEMHKEKFEKLKNDIGNDRKSSKSDINRSRTLQEILSKKEQFMKNNYKCYDDMKEFKNYLNEIHKKFSLSSNYLEGFKEKELNDNDKYLYKALSELEKNFENDKKNLKETIDELEHTIRCIEQNKYSEIKSMMVDIEKKRNEFAENVLKNHYVLHAGMGIDPSQIKDGYIRDTNWLKHYEQYLVAEIKKEKKLFSAYDFLERHSKKLPLKQFEYGNMIGSNQNTNENANDNIGVIGKVANKFGNLFKAGVNLAGKAVSLAVGNKTAGSLILDSEGNPLNRFQDSQNYLNDSAMVNYIQNCKNLCMWD